MIDEFVKAARKQRKAIESGGFGHAIYCNYQADIDRCPRCNCGVNDLLSALKKFEDQTTNISA